MIERTLVLLKPDAVKRGLMGRIISRFEDTGFKVIGAKMVQVDEQFGKKHYFDLAERRGEKVLQLMVKFLTSGSVLALCLEGVEAVGNMRKIVGDTEPKSALPGTIRGDFSHVSFAHADQEGKAVANLVHASGNVKEAEQEIKLWFKPEELYDYKTVNEDYVF